MCIDSRFPCTRERIFDNLQPEARRNPTLVWFIITVHSVDFCIISTLDCRPNRTLYFFIDWIRNNILLFNFVLSLLIYFFFVLVNCPYPLIKVFLRFSMAMPRIFFFPGHMPSKPYKKHATAIFQKPQPPRLRPCNPRWWSIALYSLMWILCKSLRLILLYLGCCLLRFMVKLIVQKISVWLGLVSCQPSANSCTVFVISSVTMAKKKVIIIALNKRKKTFFFYRFQCRNKNPREKGKRALVLKYTFNPLIK